MREKRLSELHPSDTGQDGFLVLPPARQVGALGLAPLMAHQPGCCYIHLHRKRGSSGKWGGWDVVGTTCGSWGSSCQTISDAQTHGGSGLLASVSRGEETGGEVDKGRRWLSKADASSPGLGGRCRNAMAETRGWRHRAALARAWRGMDHTWAGRCDETSADHSDAKKTRYSLESHFIRNHANLNI